MKWLILVALILAGCNVDAQQGSKPHVVPSGPSILAEETKLYNAIRANDLSLVKKLLKQGANPNSTYSNDWPMIFQALSETHEKNGMAILTAMIDAGADVNAVQPDQGWTPLHTAVSTRIGPIEAVALLIKRGANLEAQMPDAGTPLHLAVRFGPIEFVKILLDHGANIEARSVADASDRKPWPSELPEEVRTERVAIELEQARQLSGFFEPGYNQGDKTPLMEAARSAYDNVEIVQFLLDKGARIDSTDDIGRTALHEAAQAGASRVAELLIKHGAKVDATSKNGYTPLHIAANLGSAGLSNSECIEVLLAHGADPNSRTTGALTPLDVVERSRKDVLKRMPTSPTGGEDQSLTKLVNNRAKEFEAILRKHGAGESILARNWPWVTVFSLIVVGAVGLLLRRRARGEVAPS